MFSIEISNPWKGNCIRIDWRTDYPEKMSLLMFSCIGCLFVLELNGVIDKQVKRQ